MLNWFKNINKEDRFGLSITGVLHLILLIFALLYYVSFDVDNRPAYMEVTLGEFQSGTVAEYAEQQVEDVATRPNPAEEQPEDPDPEITQPAEEPQQPEEEATKPVDLTEQIEEIIDDEVIETPETEVIDPQATETTEEIEEIDIPPQTQEDEQVQEGVAESGDERGAQGDVNVDQGTGANPDRSAPYDLQWEGDLDRSPMVQPLPSNPTNEEATITVRFEVNPDGSLGRVFPLRKMNPELEREVMRTLRSWRFSRLPSGVPQEPQWGTITFRFVLD
ncbi:TonB family protein [Rhodohalobacter sp. SW132]|uniref:energy transducer TonB family protein n=1 Tax=Rhodohalobacter sp. SW132 TaxID=2293433 RepID=UPI000E23C328|nr:energy transducer TonB [Rhodohalobacter sp. SW132]REL38757.1 TonB family protein [Rhodohalobacter sp. SW132]